MRGTKLVAIVALTVLLASCKGESQSPTDPTGGGTGTTTPPPTSPSITLTSTNSSPLVDSSSVITATVTQGGSNVPNGTAVEFTTNLGTFTEANAQTVIRTTTNGQASVTLSSSTAGTATVTATVSNIARTTQVVFSTKPVTPQPPDTAPAITGFSPARGRPQGGEVVTITGKNFRPTVRVLFDLGDGSAPREGQVTSVTSTEIQVLTPAVNLGTGQQKDVTMIVITEAGTTSETRLTVSGTFTYQLEQLTPKVTTVAPTSGGIEGGTKVTVFGEGFQTPIQVFFGSAEAQIVGPVTFGQFQVIAPAARDTTPDASGAFTGFVDIRVININSGTSVTAPAIFRYIAKMQITTWGPTEGVFTGGSQVVINGTGFNDPLAVSVGGVGARVISVTPSRVVVVTNGANATSCADITGAVTVTNTDNGDSASTSNLFTYRVPKPAITFVSPNVTAGGTILVTVLNASGTPRLTLGTSGLVINSATDNGNGSTTYSATVPSNITLTTQACAGVSGASTTVPTQFDVTYTSLTTTCTDTLQGGATISPQSTATLVLAPAQFQTFTARAPVAPAVTPTPATPQTIFLANTGAAALTINSVTTTCTNPPFSISAPPNGTVLQQCDSAAITMSYAGRTTVTTEQCTVTVSTSAGTKTLTVIGQTQ